MLIVDWVGLDEAARLLRPYVWKRLGHAVAALDGRCPRYLHNGDPHGADPTDARTGNEEADDGAAR
ncbi:hypothetical protein AB0J86_19705 [Micromonospora sp. NPDC049559]|uniref:hypothetical protein n=1 Tax=Micromonospora sp. NPDC049559 TaxID=3155923 RepID=UPI00343C0847